MNPALAIFVKTPGHSPVKTRLAQALGQAAATDFHARAAAAVRAVAASASFLTPYWAVAEQEAMDAWTGFPALWQGEGELGQRLHQIYSTLQTVHGSVLLIGADAPQLTVDDLHHALHTLDTAPFVLGPAGDGGFWLFGGRLPLPSAVWTAVPYSTSSTASELMARLELYGRVECCNKLSDADRASDLLPLRDALAGIAAPLPEQRALLAWLHTDPGCLKAMALHPGESV